MPADPSGPLWKPSPDQLLAAAIVPMQYPSVLVRTIQYALNFSTGNSSNAPKTR